jgi:hypothetical protein
MKEKDLTDDVTVTVCDQCLRVTCWQGLFMCDGARDAGLVQKTVKELKALGREHPSYWARYHD